MRSTETPERLSVVEIVARAIAQGCNLDPDAISPKAAKEGHSIPEWMFFTTAASKVLETLAEHTPCCKFYRNPEIFDGEYRQAWCSLHAPREG